MSKRQLIDDIRLRNPTATVQFISQFGEADLSQYLEHLQSGQDRGLELLRR